MNVKIKNILENKFVDGLIKPMMISDFDMIIDSGHFKIFDWNNHRMNCSEMFKLTYGNNIQGVIWFHEKLGKIEIRNIEVRNENVGKNKRIDCIAGCLIAFACKHSLDNYTGEVDLITSLREHFCKKYGMTESKIFVQSDKKNSRVLVSQYLSL